METKPNIVFKADARSSLAPFKTMLGRHADGVLKRRIKFFLDLACKLNYILENIMKKILFRFIFLLSSVVYALALEYSLIEAIKNNDYPSVLKFLDLGANPDGKITDQNVISPLGLACNRGNTDIVNLLLIKGANPNYKPQNNSSPFFYTIVGPEKPEIMNLLIKYGLDINLIESDKEHYVFLLFILVIRRY